MPCKRSHEFVACWIEDPALQIHAPSQIEQGGNCASFITQVFNFESVFGVSGKPGDRMFIIHDADRDAPSPEASNNAQALIVAANDHGAHHADDRVRGAAITGLRSVLSILVCAVPTRD